MKNVINFLANLLPINKKKILFQSGRNKVDCNPYAIYKYIKKNCPNDYKCIWVVEKNTDVSMLCKGDYAFSRTIKGLFHIATSKYLIRSQSIGGILKKRSQQIYIQAWHGAGNFKKCAYDCLPKNQRPKETIEYAREWDFLLSTDKYNDVVMRSATNFNKKSLIIGNADSDTLVNASNEYKNDILKKLDLEHNNKKIIMYAPTFRDDDLEKSEINIPIMKLQKLDNYLILLRVHPLVNEKIKNKKLPKNFKNVGDYPNIQDLFLITDILITDYSSIIFPYMILNRKLILYPYDMDKYIKLRGGFYLDYKTLPGPICKNEDELLNTINNIDDISIKYKDKIKKFNEKYNSLNDGKVSKRIVDELKKGTFDNK